MEPSISVRKYISWRPGGPDEARSEPTSTVVLSEPSTGLFVDIRILKSALPSSPSSHPPYPINLRPEEVDWAFAGVSVSVPYPSTGICAYTGSTSTPSRHVTFHHVLDSRSSRPETIIDEGYMFPTEDGSQDEVERGRMMNPVTGTMDDYEERWAEEAVLPMNGAAENECKRECVVLTMADRQECGEGEGTRSSQGHVANGYVIVLGQWAQGILRNKNGDLTVERWCRLREQGKAVALMDDSWVLAARLGPNALPSPAMINRAQLNGGRSIEWVGINWMIRRAIYF